MSERMDSEGRDALDRIEDALNILGNIDYTRLFGLEMETEEADMAALAAQANECWQTLKALPDWTETDPSRRNP